MEDLLDELLLLTEDPLLLRDGLLLLTEPLLLLRVELLLRTEEPLLTVLLPALLLRTEEPLFKEEDVLALLLLIMRVPLFLAGLRSRTL